jgi:hypothetical protein
VLTVRNDRTCPMAGRVKTPRLPHGAPGGAQKALPLPAG